VGVRAAAERQEASAKSVSPTSVFPSSTRKRKRRRRGVAGGGVRRRRRRRKRRVRWSGRRGCLGKKGREENS
jgi:hypothetical protein